jgi:hypothetical protein
MAWMALTGWHRRTRRLLFAAAALLAAHGTPAHAGKNDLKLINFCMREQPVDCMVATNPATGLASTRPNAAGESDFRSLMSELGAVIAPRLETPADTLGYAGFQFSAELSFTKISANESFWDGVEGVNPTNRMAVRPETYLATVGGFVRKGLWLPLPAFEFGAGAVSIVGSQMYALQGYAKLALQEGFHGWALPSLAVRGAASQLLGTDQVDLTVYGLDVLISKAFSLAGTARFEPFAGWNYLLMDARSGVLDGTPGCDAYQLRQAAVGTPPPMSCEGARSGSWDDLERNFTFPDQDLITRQRWFGGFKLKLSALFVVGEYDILPKGTSHDESQPNHAGDRSGTQQSFSMSAGFDF